ncbi:crotonase/enoyl-CoA hydratase family protein [Aeromicrobium chenweiae]|uniref:Crotonase/enoyl-CoA hydratase family protein n=1 Tax=Aeromicrobium chenweiae TaxID=2079793 RepID=A0A2S0WHM2_9ACTN|nr:crotonase/enoyl-CoA hydratase family protein [Aeromicrobium chenweiae]AWB90784.1 crotonase/enoyl-CoA hydratase family protein [Aeromicrobium chenweiae]TGN31046.1 crotonase/enoyl-CoA hydratase family protein [Aeromicrobium chenweiae]
MTSAARTTPADAGSRVIMEIDGAVAYVTLNRPDKLNGIDLDTIDELIAAATTLQQNTEIRAVVLQGKGRSFCAGLDFASAFQDKKRVARYFFAGPRTVNRFQRVNQVWRELPVPVIAVVQGHCYGAGLQLASCADFRFTTRDATWSILEAKWGLVPDMAGTVPFSELLPADVLMRLAMTGEQISGERAAELGLATEASPDPLAAALELVEQIAQRSPDSVAATKRLVYGTRRGGLRATYRLERRLQSAMFKARNTAIARKAGTAKQTPVFGPRTFG